MLREILPDVPVGRSRDVTYSYQHVDAVLCEDRYVIPAGKHVLIAHYAPGALPGRGVFSVIGRVLDFDATPGHRYVLCAGVHGLRPGRRVKRL